MSKKEREIKFLTRIKKLRLKFFTFLLENKSDLDNSLLGNMKRDEGTDDEIALSRSTLYFDTRNFIGNSYHGSW